MARFIVILAIVFPLLEAAAETLEAAALEATTVRAEQGEAEAQYALGVHYRDSGYEYVQEAYAWIVKAAEQGHVEAQYVASQLVHIAFEWGEPSEHEKQQLIVSEARMRWLRSAAEGGHEQAQLQLANEYRLGREVPHSLEEAARWYRTAAEAGSWRGQIELAKSFEAGRGVAQDFTEALRWYRAAADAGQRSAAFEVGRYYENGLSVHQDDAEALRWYCRAADVDPAAAPVQDGDSAACMPGPHGAQNGMVSFARFLESGRAVEADPGRALCIYLAMAEEKDNLHAMRELVRVYREGVVVPRDAEKSARWAMRAIRKDEQNMFDIMSFALSNVYQSEPELKLMIRTYELAAADGEAWAQARLGMAYERGQGGLDPDLPAALRLYEAAADRGHFWGNFALGQHYLEGKKVPQDYEQAAQHLAAALHTMIRREDAGRTSPTDMEYLAELHDFAAAVHWCKERGVLQGDLFSMYILAVLESALQPTRGFAEHVQSLKWIFIAEARGYPLRPQLLEATLKQAPVEAVADAERLAREWLAAHPK